MVLDQHFDCFQDRNMPYEIWRIPLETCHLAEQLGWPAFSQHQNIPAKKGTPPHKLFIKWYSARPIGQSWSVSAKLYSTLVAVMIGSWGTHELWVSNHPFSGESITAIYSMQISLCFPTEVEVLIPVRFHSVWDVLSQPQTNTLRPQQNPNHCPWTSPIFIRTQNIMFFNMIFGCKVLLGCVPKPHGSKRYVFRDLQLWTEFPSFHEQTSVFGWFWCLMGSKDPKRKSQKSLRPVGCQSGLSFHMPKWMALSCFVHKGTTLKPSVGPSCPGRLLETAYDPVRGWVIHGSLSLFFCRAVDEWRNMI